MGLGVQRRFFFKASLSTHGLKYWQANGKKATPWFPHFQTSVCAAPRVILMFFLRQNEENCFDSMTPLACLLKYGLA